MGLARLRAGEEGRDSSVRLVVFDIDGTLTLGDGLGTRCFFSAFDEAFGVVEIPRRLEAYRESTDVGIAREALSAAWGRPPTEVELDELKAVYLRRLEQEVGRLPGAYRPVPGADRAVARLLAGGDWAVALATGNWRRAAHLKLSSAVIPFGELKGGFSEDGDSRAAVLRAALSQAGHEADPGRFERVVYVGDQPWDLAAATAAGVDFIGVESGRNGRRLAQAGASVIEDFECFESFLALLEGGMGTAAAAPAAPDRRR